MMWGIQLVSTGQPIGARAARLTRICAEHGLIVYQATGGYNDAVMIAPPLTISDAEIEELIHRLSDGFEALEAEAQAATEQLGVHA